MKLVTPATFLAALVATTSAARADAPAASPISVDVELAETTGGTTETLAVTLSLADDGACAHAATDAGTVSYRLEVCRRPGDVLTFDVSRVAAGKRSRSSRRLEMSARLAPGARAVVGRIARGDDATEVAATVTAR